MQLEQSIIEQLPQIPYVVDQVGEALSWAKEALDEGEYNKVAEVACEVAEYTKSVSDPNFFKVHYVIAYILSNIPSAKENERFAKFDSASKSVEKALEALIVSPKNIELYGCFKSVLLKLIPLSKENEELFTIALIGIKHDLLAIVKGMKQANVKTPITGNDYISILGYALIMANIRMADLHLSNSTYKVFNDILVTLNKDLNY